MTNEELKKKMCDTIMQIKGYSILQAEQIADALIAAGIGDVETVQKIAASATAMAVLEAAKAEKLKNQYCRALLNLARRYVVKTNMTLPHGNEPHSRSTDIEMLALYIMANECEQAEKELTEDLMR